MIEMNSHFDRISHFKGTPYEIGCAAGRKLGRRLEQIIDLYISGMSQTKDLQKLRSGALTWLSGLLKRFQDEFKRGMSNDWRTLVYIWWLSFSQ